ncbi:pleckstrin homology domain-containing family O member 1 [Parasteatoda tepidariorum]|uniref:pleckstrin homology domain-containing family O member 1 n=1 Tax=Parasteatoda tepidariorum TaxID=114398 RepID=UPI00077FADA2|nr:pleckstrin homology domain-containing family O member 1-A [Parasteatoda tepidariorum]
MRAHILDYCFCTVKTNMHDIPASDSFACPLRKGFLHKLTGRGWFYSGTWKSRYCVLDGSKFYFYEKEQSKGSEKSCGVLNLDYYDLCEENKTKDKKNPHVFVIGTSVKGLFDNRHQFSAETSDEMQSWIQSIQNAIAEARVNRTKPGRKKQDGKSPDLSYSSQETTEAASTTCLVNATKDRARGPQGRRLPQRKSLMPQSRSDEVSDLRQRSISLSTPQSSDRIDEEESPPSQQTSENKWLSLSMEEMERESDDAFETQRSSSAFDIHKHKDSSPQLNDGESMVKKMVRRGNLMGQHAALTKELEMKLKAGMTPGARRPPSESEDDSQSKKDGDSEKNMEQLITKVNTTKEGLRQLEDKVSLLMKTVESASENNDKAKSQAGDILLQATVTLQEAERINAECKRALTEVSEAKTEYQLLMKECERTLAKLKSDSESQNDST